MPPSPGHPRCPLTVDSRISQLRLPKGHARLRPAVARRARSARRRHRELEAPVGVPGAEPGAGVQRQRRGVGAIDVQRRCREAVRGEHLQGVANHQPAQATAGLVGPDRDEYSSPSVLPDSTLVQTPASSSSVPASTATTNRSSDVQGAASRQPRSSAVHPPFSGCPTKAALDSASHAPASSRRSVRSRTPGTAPGAGGAVTGRCW